MTQRGLALPALFRPAPPGARPHRRAQVAAPRRAPAAVHGGAAGPPPRPFRPAGRCPGAGPTPTGRDRSRSRAAGPELGRGHPPAAAAAAAAARGRRRRGGVRELPGAAAERIPRGPVLRLQGGRGAAGTLLRGSGTPAAPARVGPEQLLPAQPARCVR